MTVLYLAGGLGWGVFISTLADTQQVAFQVGAAVVDAADPAAVRLHLPDLVDAVGRCRSITHIVPARYFLVALRDIVLKGAGPEVWWDEALALVVYGAVVLLLATVRTVRSL